MKSRMRNTLGTLAIATVSLMLAACGSGGAAGNSDTAAESEGGLGTLKAVSTMNFEPFQYTTTSGEATGFEVELVETVADRLGYDDVEWTTSQFEGIIPGVAAGKYDIGASGITGWAVEGTPTYDRVIERTQQVSFTRPFYMENGMFITTDPALTNVDQLKSGDKIAVADGSQYYFWAQEHLAPKGVELLAVKQTNDAYMQLEAGLVTAIIDGRATSAKVASENDSLVIGDAIEDISGGFAWALARESTDLLDQINSEFAAMLEDGSYDELFEKYFPGADIPELPTTNFVAE